MWLFHAQTLEIVEFPDKKIPKYAILHIPGAMRRFPSRTCRMAEPTEKQAYRKIRQCGEKAANDGYQSSGSTHAA
jgi:hypothetical protein